MKHYLAFIGSLIVLVMACTSQADVTLVTNGQAGSEIVTAEKPPRMTKLAAEQLQEYIEKISGARVPIVTAPTSDAVVQIYVGRSEYTDRMNVTDEGLAYDAFRIVAAPGHLILMGHDADFERQPTYIRSEMGRPKHFEEWDALTGATWGNPTLGGGRDWNEKLRVSSNDAHGSINAVYHLLKTLGVRWYFPGALGEVLPEHKTIAIPEMDRTVKPDFALRAPMLYYNQFGHDRTGDEVLWQLRLGFNNGIESWGYGEVGHGLRNVHIRDKSDPTMFALYGGKRSIDSHWGIGAPCLSSEAFFNATVNYARKMLDIYPTMHMIDLAPVDGYANLCQCDLCKDKGTPERGWNGRMSDYVWDFTNRVALEIYKTHPDRIVSALAYSGYQQPPTNIKQMSPNLSIVICRWRANFDNADTRNSFRKLTQDWLAMLPSKEFYVWDYYLHSRPGGPTEGVPVYFTKEISEDLTFLKGKSKGDFIEVSRNWHGWNLKWHALAANHLNLYITSELYWDSDQDVQSLLTDYYEKFYGPAKVEMRQFVEYAEANWRSAARDVVIIDKMTSLLDAASQKTGDTVYGQRVQLLRDFMEPLRQKRDQMAKGRENSSQARVYYRHGSSPDVKLDGKLDEAFWQGMAIYGLKALETGAEPIFDTTFKLAYAGDSLYVGVICRETDTRSLNISSTQNEDSAIFVGDNIELLLETQTHGYYQITINPAGAMIDLDRANGMNLKWSSQAEVAVHVGEDHWTLEIRIPVAGDGQEALDADNGVSGRMPSATYPWFFNLCRQRLRENDRELSAFSPTGKPNFHDPMKFGSMYAR